jgi:hypothetical protein
MKRSKRALFYRFQLNSFTQSRCEELRTVLSAENGGHLGREGHTMSPMINISDATASRESLGGWTGTMAERRYEHLRMNWIAKHDICRHCTTWPRVAPTARDCDMGHFVDRVSHESASFIALAEDSPRIPRSPRTELNR